LNFIVSTFRISLSSINFTLLLCLLALPIIIHAQSTTDEELKALEQQIEQQEMEQAEAKRKTAVEAKRKAEEEEAKKEQGLEIQRVKEEEKQQAEEQQRKDEEADRERAESIRKEKYQMLMQQAEQRMAGDEFESAAKEYTTVLQEFPEDPVAVKGLEQAKKYMNSCNDILGTWQMSHGPVVTAHEANKLTGTWLLFNDEGVWECLNARTREFVFQWPNYGWIDYFTLSADGSRLTPNRETKISAMRK